MPQRVMRAITAPPQVFWAPLELAAMNLVFTIIIWILCVLSGLSPVWAIYWLAIGHAILAYVGSREPHAVSILKAIGNASRPTTNLIKIKGNKFVP